MNITVITPEDWQITTEPKNTFRWIVRDSDSGANPDTITLRIDGEKKSGVTYVGGGNEYFCEWTGAVAEGAHVVAFDASNNSGNAAETVILNYAAIFFITDRAEADVERVVYLNRVMRSGAATALETAEWESNPRGAYNASDMNRVGLAAWFLKNWSARYGFNLPLSARRNWAETVDGPTDGEGETYLSDIQAIRAELPVYDEARYGSDGANYTFHVTNDGNLMMRYSGGTPPLFSINKSGHLIFRHPKGRSPSLSVNEIGHLIKIIFRLTPDAPESMRFFTYGGANNIEHILTDAIKILPTTSLSFVSNGEGAAGEF